MRRGGEGEDEEEEDEDQHLVRGEGERLG